ncbi:MAG: Holliday junction branch migration protein RuvA [Ignavibacteriales bacterium]|nr:MAG: Holliday junction branch migration protein RuvA [Ignavibacteriaceae bacterium]MBW7872609.1 Holliday junction branch migration protein RuvA [Ignavibacteria bacterium]MCZ2141838.1 Holliday junction branch migration protein RuvA [Ignavibacteriales bacterium]OQY73844.1 MAG: Holliday junction branch migration protein RuvA [Ignavibacteriales bacterium UTCHB3]MBV6445005.1 Holliday junction ATP-dependent DNA helicase RuvA [Ignavibacteriaceae bacterium]
MIGYLKGKLLIKKPTRLLLDVNGVGYEVSVSLMTFDKLGDSAETALFIHTHVTQDAITLYGFIGEDEREMFRLLISVSGIGPKTALALLSGIRVDELRLAIESGDTHRINAAPGIGKKTAERLILELKSKVGDIQIATPSGFSQRGARAEALTALTTLGFNAKSAEKVIDSVLTENPASTVEEIVKQALRKLSG